MYNTEFTPEVIETVRTAAAALVNVLTKETAMKVSTTNKKLNHLAQALGLNKTQVVAIDGLAGVTCPFADICKAWVTVDDSGKRTITKGEHCEFTCYAASIEARYTAAYNAHKHNTDIVNDYSDRKDVIGLAALLLASIWYKSPTIARKGGVVRWHASGDFHKKTYVEAAALVQLAAPEIEFFGYSKSPWVVQALSNGTNGAMVHSHGSKFDSNAVEAGLPQSFVQCFPGQYNVPIACVHPTDTDDYTFIKAGASFSINVH